MTDQSFHILQISSFSDHPVRNSANDFIFGNHMLWEANKTYVDDNGSIAPNVFSYDFTSPLASNSTLNITIKVVNHELVGENLFLNGLLDGIKVFESQVPITETAKETTTIAVFVSQPDVSPEPISFTGDFTWEIAPKEQNPSGGQIAYACADKTRLELYWISPDIHEIFYAGRSGIAVDFLRSAFNYPNWPQVTQQVFYNYSKVYDTIQGRSGFGLSYTGGRFQYTRYIARRTPTSPPGSQYPVVNCYDQAAMVQVLGTVRGGRPTWLFMQPFGSINNTYLVGVPGLCNNPFFRSNNTPQYIGPQDRRRTSFGNHVFNGHLQRFDYRDLRDRMYDACSGPRLGTHHAQGYLDLSIDRGRTPHGTVQNITQYTGVTGRSLTLSLPSDVNGEELLQKYATGNTKPCSQVHWNNVSQWIKTVLGDSCDVTYHDTDIGDGVATAFWSLSGIDGVEGDVEVKIRAETCVGTNGNIDYGQSSRVSFNDLVANLINVELDLGPDYENLHNIWTPAPFGDYAKYALQYAPHIAEGRVLLVSGNVLIDISGGSSSSALEPFIQKLLTYTTVDTLTPSSLHILHIPDYSYEILETNKDPNSLNEVKGLFTSFDVKCHVDDLVAVATADVEGYGILLSQYKIENNEVDKTSTVTFTFVTRKVGVHDINLRFEEASTMKTGIKKIQVSVIDA